MAHTTLGNLRRARSRVHKRIAEHERMLDGYRAKLVALESEIHAIAPELLLQPAHRARSAVFKRGELTRLSLNVMREANEPLSVPQLAVRLLALKGHALPAPRLRRIVQHRLRQMFVALDRRGVTVRNGEGKGVRRGLADHRYSDGPPA